MKNFIIAALFSSLILTAHADAELKDSNLKSYVSEWIHYWFGVSSDAALKPLIKAICKEVRNSNAQTITWNWNSLAFDYSYSRNYIEEVMRTITIDFIEENAYQNAKVATGSKAIANQIMGIIHSQLLNIFAQYEIPYNAVAAYHGTSLRTYINTLYNWILSGQPPVVYY